MQTRNIKVKLRDGEMGAYLAFPDKTPAEIERAAINLAKDKVTQALSTRRDILKSAALDARLASETIDVTLPLREAREIFERDYLMAQINRFGGNISRTAAFIGMERSALHRKLKSLGVGSAQSFPN